MTTYLDRVGTGHPPGVIASADPVDVSGQPTSLGCMDTLAPWAGQLALELLQESLPRRWAHVQGVAARARSLAPVLGADTDLLKAAA